jgi:hypothetical protein
MGGLPPSAKSREFTEIVQAGRPSACEIGGKFAMMNMTRTGQGTMKLDQATREALRKKLEDLRSQHRDLDDVIERVTEQVPFDQLQVQRLKKRKLNLKDQIAKIESQLLPDIIA